jgi:hypothetical protein
LSAIAWMTLVTPFQANSSTWTRASWQLKHYFDLFKSNIWLI